ncbi:hypothetical protein [Mucilaginibacter aquatilis]|uniref:hypothetical protein n=1 Tax=Mucilaginibacter aquatilis TaxID=1517760 RepID=UPI001E350DC6|nr:hypothetical protein [Mucilaginibacter aquatilis]
MKFWMDKQAYNFKNNIKQWMSSILEIVFQAATLCINTIRTFILIVLAILGPLVLGLSVFDGFQNTFTQWMARYINVFLWLPVANIFGATIGKVQEKMLALDISQVHETGSTFFSSADTAYIIFLIIGIAGYFCVPSVAGYIVHAAGGSTIMQKVNQTIVQTSNTTISSAQQFSSALANKISSWSQPSNNNNNQSHSSDAGNQYMKDRLSGN